MAFVLSRSTSVGAASLAAALLLPFALGLAPAGDSSAGSRAAPSQADWSDAFKLNEQEVAARRHMRAMEAIASATQPTSLMQELQAYVRATSDRDLLQLSYELCEQGAIEAWGVILSAELNQRWANTPPTDDLAREIERDSSDPSYRAFLLDLLRHQCKAHPEARARTNKACLKVGRSDAAPAWLRRFALLKIAPADIPVATSVEMAATLVLLVNDAAAPADARGAALSALQRVDDDLFVAIASVILSRPSEYQIPLVRHAMYAAGRSPHALDFVASLGSIAASTEDASVFSTAVASLGEIGTVESLGHVVAVRGRFGQTRICDAVLRQRVARLQAMLASDADEKHLMIAVLAAEHAALADLRPALESLARRLPSASELSRKTHVALASLPPASEPTPGTDRPSKTED